MKGKINRQNKIIHLEILLKNQYRLGIKLYHRNIVHVYIYSQLILITIQTIYNK